MKFENGVRQIQLQEEVPKLTQHDKINLCFTMLGASVSSMPRNYRSRTETDKLELFDPEKVVDSKKLSSYWRKIWELHNQPERRDCVKLRYRYVHVPHNILPQYPRVPCKGVFCLTSREVKWYNITPNNLIHIGTSTDEGW